MKHGTVVFILAIFVHFLLVPRKIIVFVCWVLVLVEFCHTIHLLYIPQSQIKYSDLILSSFLIDNISQDLDFSLLVIFISMLKLKIVWITNDPKITKWLFVYNFFEFLETSNRIEDHTAFLLLRYEEGFWLAYVTFCFFEIFYKFKNFS